MTQSIQPPPNYRSAGSVTSLSAPVQAITITENPVISYVVPANSLAVGSLYQIFTMGRMTPPLATTTLTWRLKIGAVILASTITTPGVTVVTPFYVKCLLACTVNGTLGRFNGGLIVEMQGVAAAQQHIGNVPGANLTNVDTTLSQTVSLTYQWSAAPAAGGFSAELASVNIERM